MATPQIIRNFFESQEHEEGLSKVVEKQATKVPSNIFLTLALASIVASLGIATLRKKAEWANFVGLWAPSFMLIGIYNQLFRKREQNSTNS